MFSYRVESSATYFKAHAGCTVPVGVNALDFKAAKNFWGLIRTTGKV